MKIIDVAITSLKEYENNPRNNDKSVEKVAHEIYGIVNKSNGKIYIGQTKQGHRKRFSQHLCPTDGSPLLNAAIKKYGKNCFECELLDVAYSQEEANVKEKMWIKALKTYVAGNGYNLSLGGAFGSFNEETLRKMSEAHKGEKNHFYSKHHTQENREKMAELKRGKYGGSNHPRARKVKCVETGEIFLTIKEAADKYNVSHGHISQACQNKKGRKKVGGLSWSYAE